MEGILTDLIEEAFPVMSPHNRRELHVSDNVQNTICHVRAFTINKSERIRCLSNVDGEKVRAG